MKNNVTLRPYLSVFAVVLSATTMAQGEAWQWPAYNPTIVFNFSEFNKDYSVVPTKNFEGDCFKSCGNHKDKDWWTFIWGNNLNPVFNNGIEASADGLLERFNTDFDYITNVMGWPRDSRADDGYRSAVFLYGSNGCTGSNDNTELGGWQSWVDGYPAVVASYYPIYSFDPKCTYHDRESQMSAMVHEGIHSIMSSLGAKHVHWAQEGGNTWLQQEMEVQRSGQNEEWHGGMGFLNAAAVIAPFIPIECYSGWLLDGSFGGPGAQGVGSGQYGTDVNGNMVEKCNWRTTLGGYQYGNMFFTFLGEWISKTSVPWIWGNCNDQNKYILETIASQMGDTQTRHLIMEYRAKLALCDMKKWSRNCVELIDQNWGSQIKQEWEPAAASVDVWKCTPYTVTTKSGNELTPENRTTPGWSGANIIPLTVETGATAAVTLKQIGDNMSLQLCYRATDGTPVYSEPVMGDGTAYLKIEKPAQKNVIFAVVCNTDYAYKGDATRKKHHDYRLTIENGITGTADPYTAWYRDFNLAYDWEAVSNCVGAGEVPPAKENEVHSLSYDVQVPYSEDYTPFKATINTDSLVKWLGLSADDIHSGIIGSNVKLYALRPDGTLNKSAFTANNGFWYAEDGTVTNWGETAKMFVECDAEALTFNIGNYPNAVVAGNEYTLGISLVYDFKQVDITFNITIAADKSGILQNESGALSDIDNLSVSYDNGTPVATYTVPQTSMTKLSLYTANGHLIRHIVNENTEAGTYTTSVILSEYGVSDGVYLLKLSYSGGEVTKVFITRMK